MGFDPEEPSQFPSDVQSLLDSAAISQAGNRIQSLVVLAREVKGSGQANLKVLNSSAGE